MNTQNAATDTKGRPLIDGAWYCVWNDDESGDDDMTQAGGASIVQWSAELNAFITEDGDEADFWDPICQMRTTCFDKALLLDCKAATASGVHP